MLQTRTSRHRIRTALALLLACAAAWSPGRAAIAASPAAAAEHARLDLSSDGEIDVPPWAGRVLGGLSVELPSEPREREKRIWTPIGRIDYRSWKVKTEQVRLEAHSLRFGGILSWLGTREGIYDLAVEKFLELAKADPIREAAVECDPDDPEAIGRRLYFRRETGQGEARFCLIGNQLYVANSSTRVAGDASADEQALRFMRSVRIRSDG